MPIELPDLDLRNEEELVAEVIDALPAELSDRNRSNPEVKLIEGIGAFYGALLYQLNQVPERLQIALVNLLGIEREQPTHATVTLGFTATTTVTVPAGTRVKTGTDSSAVFFATDAELIITSPATTGLVSATAEDAGSAGNVAAGTLVRLHEPIGGVSAVTNPAAASGGQDLEALDAVFARVPLGVRALERAINDEDFAYHAERIDGVSRAIAFAHNGAVTIHILAEDLNASDASALRTAVQSDLLTRTLPSVVVTVAQPAIRLVQITDIEVKLASGATTLTVENAARVALGNFITARPIVASDNSTIQHEAWPWGESIWRNDLIALLNDVDGVVRIGRVWGRYSDDYGLSWSTSEEINEIPAAANGLPNTNFGLLNYDDASITVTAL